MDILDKFLHSIAYKFPKGYPDIKNDQDILMLENLLKETGIDVKITESTLSSAELEKPYTSRHEFSDKYGDRGERFLEKIINKQEFELKDGSKIIIDIDDTISGIEPKEKSFSIKLNEEKLFCAYQPVKKQISYRFDRGLSPGEHQLHITVLDKVGNKIEKNILFKCE